MNEDKAASPAELALAALAQRIAADDQIPSNLKAAMLADLETESPATLANLKTSLAGKGDGIAS